MPFRRKGRNGSSDMGTLASPISMANSFGISGKVKRLEKRSSVLGKVQKLNLVESFTFLGSLEHLYGSHLWWMMAATFLWGCIPKEPKRGLSKTIDSRLVSIDYGTWEFFMWTTGGAGSVDLVLNTDGITTDDRIDAPAPGHWHQNWAFDTPVASYTTTLRVNW